MTVSQRHAEWISLLEVSGSFLAVAVLEDVFPQGLDKVTTPFRQRIRAAYEEWRDAVDESDPQTDAIHREWVRLVIQDFLEYDPSVLKSGSELPAGLLHHDVQSDITFRPDYAVMAGNNAKLLISVTLPGVDLENPLPSDSWLASPSERMMSLCRSSGVPLGMVTNGERWMVVSAHGEGVSSRASWYARLWFQESVTLQAFYSLLGVRRSFGEESQTLEALIRASMEHQDEVTDTLGEQVRRAVEVLVQALDRADLDRNRSLLKDVTPAQLFEAGLTVMMRLVVVLCAEERKLLLLGEPVYDQNYAISTLRSQLAAQASHGLELLERRQDAWSRLLATFRGLYGGISHETLRLPPLGGSLFDPDRFPFLEGRAVGTSWRDSPAFPLPIDNRTVLLLLNALQVLEYKSGARLLSYEALDVEQIGHVYEGLLERTVKRVPEITLGLLAASTVRKKTGHPEIHLSELEAMAASGHEKLLAFVIEKTGRSKSAIKNELDTPLSPKLSHLLLAACGGDLRLTARIKPFANLLRTDSWGDPLIYPANAFIVTHGVGRRETGSHYTPKSLTEPIVQHTLEPLAYFGPGEGKPREEWQLKKPAELLALKVCDMAMGSGAFLVQTCRWLGEQLVEAWHAEEKGGRAISIEGVVLEQLGDAELMPRDQAERVLIARRLIASRCIYGVDINPIAVELGKLSLWLVTMMRNRPFNFLDHALKCGDSLLGVSDVGQLERFSIRNSEHAQPLLETANLRLCVEQAATLRRELEAMPSHTAAQIQEKARLHAEAETQLVKLRTAADFLLAAELLCTGSQGWNTRRAMAASQMQAAWKESIDEFQRLARIELNGCRAFHWPLEFPEIFNSGKASEQDGFDAFIGNPPFLGGKQISSTFSEGYWEYCRRLFPEIKGNMNYVGLFLRRAADLTRAQSGQLGFLAAKGVAEGDTREGTLVPLIESGFSISWAKTNFAWPGTASVFVSAIGIARGSSLHPILNGKVVARISSRLEAEEEFEPFALASNFPKNYNGMKLGGEGFILENDHPSCPEIDQVVIRRFYRSGEVFSAPNTTSPTFVVDFESMTESEAREYRDAFDWVSKRVKPYRITSNRSGWRKYWWRHAEVRTGLRQAMSGRAAVLIIGGIATYHRVQRCPVGLYDHNLVVVPDDSLWMFGILQSGLHEAWAAKLSSSLSKGGGYRPSDCLDTFPLPRRVDNVTLPAGRFFAAREGLLASIGTLNGVYARFHDPKNTEKEILVLRQVMRELDQEVAKSYDWCDLDLGHDFHEAKQGVRWTLNPEVSLEILKRLLALNHQRHSEEVTAGLHDMKGGKKKFTSARLQGPELALEPAKPVPSPANTKPKNNRSEPGRSSADVQQSELLNAIFTCASRREITDREDLARQVAGTLHFQRLTSNLREVIANGINSAIRRGLVSYDAKNIHRVAASYAELDHEFLVKAINASIRSGCVYTPEEVLRLAADYLGCQRLKDGFRDRLESALNAASRRGILARRGEEIRKKD